MIEDSIKNDSASKEAALLKKAKTKFSDIYHISDSIIRKGSCDSIELTSVLARCRHIAKATLETLKRENKPFEVGDIVGRKDGRCLRSGCSAYATAVVISLEPFAIVSETGDMLWQSTAVPTHFEVKDKASQSVLDICMRRLKDVNPSISAALDYP
jgi:hypothetical protein